MFDAWRQESWDVNDTLLIADPRTDADVGDRFTRLLGTAPGAWTSWHDQRIGGTLGGGRAGGGEERPSAHAATPGGRALRFARPNVPGDRRQRHGRPLPDAHGQRHREQAARDLRRARPARVRVLLARTGRRRRLPVRRRPRSRRQRALSLRHGRRRAARAFGCDGQADPRVGCARPRVRAPLRSAARARRTATSRAERRTTILLERSIYGEGMAESATCAAGCSASTIRPAVASTTRYDYKGNLVASTRQLAAEYRNAVDWSALANLTDRRGARCGRQARAGRRRPVLCDEHVYDALNRAIQAVTPHSATMKPNVIRRLQRGEPARPGRRVAAAGQRRRPGCSIPRRPTLHAVTGIEYNAHGQRIAITFGNGDGHDVRLRSADVPARAPRHDAPELLPGERAHGAGSDLHLRSGRQHHAHPATTRTFRT